MDNAKTFWLPEKASTFTSIVDPAFDLYLWISVFFFGLIVILITVFTFKYLRRRPDQLATAQITHNLTLELSWTIIPLIIVMALFFVGMKGFLHMRVAPSGYMQVNVKGQKWSWSFEYPAGAVNDTLVVPVNTPVKLAMTSRDVIHSFFIPAFRAKADVLPNRWNAIWFQATRTGVFPVECTQYCGTNHSYMWTAVKVVEPDVYQEWLANASDPGKGKTPEQFGALLYQKRGCNACHSIDGSKGVGPSWKGLYGRQETTNMGMVMVDEAYLKESMMVPTAKVVTGFQPVMPVFQGVLSDREIAALMAYIKSLK
ncbi:MAG: cytochrome c oxidase subunit II [Fibrobacteres bacterium]|nr:cytochrome c oxidase subunit II [Fibrobacterota bacterium]